MNIYVVNKGWVSVEVPKAGVLLHMTLAEFEEMKKYYKKAGVTLEITE